MGVEITCKCGERVPFDLKNSDTAPISEVCDFCGRVWLLRIELLRDVGDGE